MKKMFFCIFTLISSLLAVSFSSSSSCHHKECCVYAESAFATSNIDQFYDINTLFFPATVPLSLNGNHGLKKGKIKTTPTGITILEEGDYLVTFSTLMNNFNSSADAIIAVFLVENGVFNPNSPFGTTIGSTARFSPNFLNTVTATGILKHVKKGTILSLLASNGGSEVAPPVTVLNWNIVATKLCCAR